MPYPFIDFVVQVVYCFDLSVSVLLDLWFGFGGGELPVGLFGVEGESPGFEVLLGFGGLVLDETHAGGLLGEGGFLCGGRALVAVALVLGVLFSLFGLVC